MKKKLIPSVFVLCAMLFFNACWVISSSDVDPPEEEILAAISDNQDLETLDFAEDGSIMIIKQDTPTQAQKAEEANVQDLNNSPVTLNFVPAASSREPPSSMTVPETQEETTTSEIPTNGNSNTTENDSSSTTETETVPVVIQEETHNSQSIDPQSEEVTTSQFEEESGAIINPTADTFHDQQTIVEAPIEEEKAEPIRLVLETIYFDFDEAKIRDDDKEVLQRNLDWLKAHPEVTILLAGHADERGSNEYNLALGEERSNSVLKYLISLGANPLQFRTVSYGEERPAALGKDSQSYAKNRRVEFSQVEL